MTIRLRAAFAAFFLCAATFAAAAPQPIDRFARRPQIHGVTLSADGRYVAFLSGVENDTVLMTYDRTTGGSFKRVTTSEPDKFDIGWCRWANDKRLLCGVYGNIRGRKYAEPPFQRLFAVNADGAGLKVLEGSRNSGNLLVTTTSMRNLNMNQGAAVEKSSASSYGRAGTAEFSGASVAENYVTSFRPDRNDSLIDITPDDQDNVLLQVDDNRDSYPSIFSLNIYTGARSPRSPDHPPIQSFVTDGQGNPRFGIATGRNLDTSYYVRLEGEQSWRKLAVAPADANKKFRLVAMAPGSTSAYAYGLYEGKDALWTIDLAEKTPPKLLFHHPLVDVGEPILQSDRQLIGVRYDVERPYVWYADPKFTALIDKLEKQYTGKVHEIVDSSQDRKVVIVRTSSDKDEGSYTLFDLEANKQQRLGSAYPELEQTSLGKMTNILYKATDGTEIPGYLTVPAIADQKNLPLIVMPHDGPQARDSWDFSFLRTFLANRGYAVLQMNYRGSIGFGEKLRVEGNQDWAGLTYSDIQDGTRWAVSEGIADPKRICILGWGFGGYEALLSAVRNGETYKCAVSIGGISDLVAQQEHATAIGNKEARKAIGNDNAKLDRGSPLKEVKKINIPVLLVHGTKDWQVQMEQTKAMSDALDQNDKKYTEVLIEGATHDLERKSDRMQLLKAVEDFLAQNLNAS